MQKKNAESVNFRLLTSTDSEDWYLTARLTASDTGKLVILDNTGNLVSRQIVKLVKGDNSIPVPKSTFSNQQIHVIIFYLGNEIVFSQLVMNKIFLHK